MYALGKRADVKVEACDRTGRCVRCRRFEGRGADCEYAAVTLHLDHGEHAAGVDGASVGNRPVHFFDRDHVGHHWRIKQRSSARQDVFAKRRGSSQDGLRAAVSRCFRDHCRVTVGQRFRQCRVVSNDHCRRAVGNKRRGDPVQAVAEHKQRVLATELSRQCDGVQRRTLHLLAIVFD